MSRFQIQILSIHADQCRLGSSLQGAHLIWDDLLVSLCASVFAFRTALVTSLLRGVTAPTTTDPAKDVEEEAIAMWVWHIVNGGAYTLANMQDQDALLSTVMRWCCLHPGHWTEQIGRQVLETSEEVRDEWTDLFEASLIRADIEASTGASQEPVMLDPGADQERVVGVEADIHTTRGWSRAIAPAAVPIGVVK